MHVCRDGFAFDGQGNASWARPDRVRLAERRELLQDDSSLPRRRMGGIPAEFSVGRLGETRKPVEREPGGSLAHFCWARGGAFGAGHNL